MSIENINPGSLEDKKAEDLSEEQQVEHKKHEWKYVFPAVKSELPYAFYRLLDPALPNNVVYSSIHFDGAIFRSPENMKEITVPDFLIFLKERLGAEKIILSCCYPDRANKIIGEISGLEVLGAGDCEVRTIYNDRKGVITVESAC